MYSVNRSAQSQYVLQSVSVWLHCGTSHDIVSGAAVQEEHLATKSLNAA